MAQNYKISFLMWFKKKILYSKNMV